MAAKSKTNMVTLILMVLFIFAFIFSTGLAVMFHSKIEENVQARREAVSELAKYIKPEEAGQGSVARLLTQAQLRNRSAVAQLQADTRTLTRMIVGGENIPLEQLEQKLIEAGVNTREGENVVSALTLVESEAKSKTEELLAVEATVEELKGKISELETQVATNRRGYEAQVAELSQNLEGIKTEHVTYQQKVETARTNDATRLEEAEKEFANRLRDKDGDIRKMDNEITKGERTINELRNKLKEREQIQVKDPTSDHDGRIVSVLEDDNLVYIDLGRRDRLILGMTFEVFDSSRGVRVDEEGRLRGKATIEVVDIDPSSAACRIVRRPQFAKPVLINDLISNLVYDKYRTFKFHIFGNYDLDNDGKTAAADRDRIQGLVSEWGGKQVDRLAYDTDFLVLGMEPDLPQQVTPTDTPEDIQRKIRQKKEFEEYNSLVKIAQNLSIPVLNQNRFLGLIGYYDR